MNMMIIVSIVINAVVTVAFAVQYPEYQARIVVVLGYFVALSIAGVVMIAAGSKKQGAIMVTIGCFVFVPIGFIGVFGAKKVLDEVKRSEFAKSAPPNKTSTLLKISPLLMLGIAVILFFITNVTSTTLQEAVNDGSTWVVKVKLQTGASPEEIQDALFVALGRYGLEDIARILLDHGASANARDPRNSGRTPLMTADFNAYTTQLLIERGADVNARDDQGATALIGARRIDAARILIDRGADVNAANNEGSTALMNLVKPSYCEHYRHDDRIVLLLEHGSKINAKDKDGNTALLHALDVGSKKGCLTSERIDDISLLISRGADVNMKNKHGITPLMLAQDVQNNRVTQVDVERLNKMLKKAGAVR